MSVLVTFSLTADTPTGQLIYLPSGDGVCICLVNQLEPSDNHIILSLRILERLHEINRAEKKEVCRFEVQIGRAHV